MFHRVVSPGVELRSVREEHAEALFALTQKNRERLRRWLPWVDRTRSVEDVRFFINHQAMPQYNENRGVHAGIWVEGKLAGSAGCHPIDWANRSTSIGYWLDADFEGRGLVTQCCAVLLDYLFHDMGLHRVEIRCGTGNHRSCAVPERLGFTREGIARHAEWVAGRFHDLYVWSMLAEEWQARRPGAGTG